MKSVRYAIIAVILFIIPLAVYATPIANITVKEAGDFYYWFSYNDISGKTVITTPRGFKDKKVSIDLPLVKDQVAKSTLYVLDAKTGNEAVLPVAPKADIEYKFDIRPSDFDRARRVKVAVISSAKKLPVAAAIVKLEDGGGAVQTQILDPSAGGVAQFTDVPTGTVKISVTYGDGKSTSQDIDVPLDREEAVPTVEVPVVGDVDTIQASQTVEPGNESGGPDHKPASSKPAPVNFFSALVGLLVFAGIVVGVVVLLRNRGATLRKALESAGIDLPNDMQPSSASQPAPAVQVDPSVCPFCGGKKDPATGACACSVGASPAAGMSAVSSGPRLIATQGVYSGNIYTLGAGVTTIGREESNTIAFPQDSTSSRRHARIDRSNGDIKIFDEGSSNGTFVNGVKVTEQVLRPGDEIQVGNTRLRFEE